MSPHIPGQRGGTFPLHQFQADGDSDNCGYVSRGLMCGALASSSVHSVVRVPGPGQPYESGTPAADAVATMGTKMHETIENYVRAGKVSGPGYTETMVANFFRDVEKLVALKDEHYGAAWRRQGYMGNLARILGKADRLRNMAWRDEQQHVAELGGEETACDTVRDMAALCAMFEANLLSGNRWGENA